MSVSKPRVYGWPVHTSASVVQQQRSHQEHSSYTERTRGGSLSVFRCLLPPLPQSAMVTRESALSCATIANTHQWKPCGNPKLQIWLLRRCAEKVQAVKIG